MKWRAYPKYQDSGIEWLGKIPEHWSGTALKRWVEVKITDGPHETPEFVDEGIPFASADAVRNGRIDFDFKRGYIRPELHARYIRKVHPKRDDIFMVKSGATTGKLAIVDVDFEFSVWSPLALIRANPENLTPNFLFSALHADYIQNQVQRTWSEGTQPNISMAAIERLYVVAPPLSEQRAIATFLDHKTAHIDALIAKKEHQVELLQEKRAALISHAVTKGLDPSVPMKDSGIEWLGEIPAHWEVKQIRYIAESLQTGPFGSQLHSSDYVTDGTPVINPSHMKDGYIEPDHKVAIDDKTCERLARHKLCAGDIVFARRGELGRCALVTLAEEGWLCGTGSLRMRSKLELAYPPFLNRVLSTNGVSEWLLLQSVGSTMDNLNTSILSQLALPIPPLNKQHTIAVHLDHEIVKIDALTAKVQESIERLQEYRTALVSAAVTGKIDVRGEQVQRTSESALHLATR